MNNKSIYIIAIIFLLVTNIVTVISARRYSVQKEEITRPVASQPQDLRMGFFMGSLGISQEQEPEFRRFNAEYNREVANLNNNLASLRQEMISEISSEDPDPDKLDSVLNQFGDEHIKMKRATIKYYENLKSICNDEQKEKLGIFFNNMLDPQGPIYNRGNWRGGRNMGPGQGRQRGNGRGMRWNAPPR